VEERMINGRGWRQERGALDKAGSSAVPRWHRTVRKEAAGTAGCYRSSTTTIIVTINVT